MVYNILAYFTQYTVCEFISFYLLVRVFFVVVVVHFHCCLVFHFINITWFIHFSVGHLGGFQFLAIMCKSALNILLCVLWWTYIYAYVELFGAHLYRVGMLGHRVCIYWDLIEYFNVCHTMDFLCINLSNIFHSGIHLLYYKLCHDLCSSEDWLLPISATSSHITVSPDPGFSASIWWCFWMQGLYTCPSSDWGFTAPACQLCCSSFRCLLKCHLLRGGHYHLNK